MKTTTKVVNRFVKMKAAALAALAFAALASAPAMARDNDNDGDDFKFDLVRTQGLNSAVAPNAHGRVKIESVGPVEIMKVKVWGLPANTDFDLFVIQVPNAPFGEAWYQGDIETNKDGVGYGEFIGRFNIETFIISNGNNVPAPEDPFHDPTREILSLSLASVTACRHPLKWSIRRSELAGVKNLDARVMLSIKRGDSAWATCFYHVLRVVEPEAEVINLDRVYRDVLIGISNAGNWSGGHGTNIPARPWSFSMDRSSQAGNIICL